MSETFTNKHINTLINNSLLFLGSLFTITGMCEFFSGQNTSMMLSKYRENIPDIINLSIRGLDNLAQCEKSGLGALFLGAWVILRKPRV